MTGKFRTECFGSYEQFSGGNNHVSVQEIRESKKKIISALNVVSEKHGTVSFLDFINKCNLMNANVSTDNSEVDAFIGD